MYIKSEKVDDNCYLFHLISSFYEYSSAKALFQRALKYKPHQYLLIRINHSVTYTVTLCTYCYGPLKSAKFSDIP